MTKSDNGSITMECEDQIIGILLDFGAIGFLHLVLDFDVFLDAAVLRQATRRLLDAEPVLGCRFEGNGPVPVWRRRTDLEERPGFATINEVIDLEGETAKLVNTVDRLYCPNTRVWLLRHSGGDRLILSVSHAVADGIALTVALERLAELYSGLVVNPNFRLLANPASRDSFAWLTKLSFPDRIKVVVRDVTEIPRMLRRPQGFLRNRAEFDAAPRARPALAKLSVPPERLAVIDAAAKARGLSRNDMLMAGFARAFVAFCDGEAHRPLQIEIPVNLRRYTEIEHRPAICNLSRIAHIFIEPNLGARFHDTLNRIACEMLRQRKAFMGVPNPYTTKLFASLSFARKFRFMDRFLNNWMHRPVPPTFTNIKRIHESRVRFAGTSPGAVTFYVASSRKPIVIVAASEYGRSMTLTMSYDLDDYRAESVNRFLADMVDCIDT